jgi:GNAT superfamily N-acetyltransferase
MAPPQDIAITMVDAETAGQRLHELTDLLVDAVEHGASVNFLAGVPHATAASFWQDQLPGIAQGSKLVLIAERAGRIIGTVMVMFAPQPNAPHRAEVGKMLVHSSLRRQGLGRRLLLAAEQAAAAAGRTLLLLDTETGSAGDRLYRACGWQEIGTVPQHAYRPNGALADTTIFYKKLGAHRSSP